MPLPGCASDERDRPVPETDDSMTIHPPDGPARPLARFLAHLPAWVRDRAGPGDDTGPTIGLETTCPAAG